MELICPKCKIHTDVKFIQLHYQANEQKKGYDQVKMGRCTSCKELLISYAIVSGNMNNTTYSLPTRSGLILPIEKKSDHDISEHVPPELSADYFEAVNTLDVSAKASATMSRRCLQNFFHNHMDPPIKGRGLDKEIELFLELKEAPKHILTAVDYIRHVGNYSAHPKKSAEVDKLIDVEPGEAEWSITVLQMLFEFYYESKHQIETKKRELTERLGEQGKSINWKIPK